MGLQTGSVTRSYGGRGAEAEPEFRYDQRNN